VRGQRRGSLFDSYQPVRGTSPTRVRSDHNPLSRKEYLLHVMRRVAGGGIGPS
jgi:ribosomal protection tetracycline resistance protein